MGSTYWAPEFANATYQEWGDFRMEEKRVLEWNPGKSLLKALRAYQRAGNVFTRKLAALRFRLWRHMSHCDLCPTTKIGIGFRMPHPQNIVIHPRVTFGVNCVVFQNVTIGTRGGQEVPTIGSDVEVGPGACILGGVIIGDGARIGANAVVLKDVPAGAMAVGVPARIIYKE